MNRMRKGLAALAAAVFFLSVGGVAQAVIGIPDDVPGSTLLFPFFKVNPTRTVSDTQDTLLIVTNTAGATDPVESAYAPNVAVHVTIWSVASIHVLDFTVILTPHDVWSCSLYDLIIGGSGVTGCDQVLLAPPIVRDRLLSEVDGKPTLVGYVTADLVFSDPRALFPGQVGYPFGRGNVLIGHMYLVNLINGSSTGFNAVSLETDNPCFGHNALPVSGQLSQNSGGFYRTRCEDEQGGAANCAPSPRPSICYPPLPYGDYNERIDGPNGDWAQTGDAGGFQVAPTGINVLPDSPLSLIIRYLSSDTISARTEVWLWKDRNTTGTGESINVAVYDEAERVHSVQLLIPREVNFAMTNQIITPGAPGGWFRVKYVCNQFSSCSYNYTSPSSGGARPPIQAVAYAVQFANSANATLRWDAAFPAHRQYTDYLGVDE